MAKKKNKNVKGNREYKNDTFCMLMKYRDYALDVYNALNDSDYTDASIVTIVTMEKGISLSVRNDAAFVVYTDLNLYEHQSTYCPNMPLRSLLYFADTIKQMINKKDIYGKRLVKLPTPHFVVFYNGIEKRPEKEVLRLSDAFVYNNDVPEIELEVTVYNINDGNNVSITKKSKVLDGYMIFVDKVRTKKETVDMLSEDEYTDIVEEAINECIEEGVLKEFFEARGEEIVKAMILDYTFERREEIMKEETLQEGIAIGIERGIEQGIESKLINLIAKKLAKGKDIATIADEIEESEEVVRELIEKNKMI